MDNILHDSKHPAFRVLRSTQTQPQPPSVSTSSSTSCQKNPNLQGQPKTTTIPALAQQIWPIPSLQQTSWPQTEAPNGNASAAPWNMINAARTAKKYRCPYAVFFVMQLSPHLVMRLDTAGSMPARKTTRA